MTFKVEFSFSTFQELQSFIAATSSTLNEGKPLIAEAAAPVKVSRPAKSSPKPDIPPLQEVEKTPSFIGKKEEKVEEPILEYKYVSQATLDAVKAVGRDAVAELLQQFGAPTAKELPEEHWGVYMKKCGELIKSKKEDALV